MITLPEPSAPFSTVVADVVGAGDGTLVDATTVGYPPTLATLSSSCTRSMAAAEVAGTARDAATAAVAVEVAADAFSTPGAGGPSATSSVVREQMVSPTYLSLASPLPSPAMPPGNEAIAAAAAAAAAVEEEEEEEEEEEVGLDSLCGPAPTVEDPLAESWAPNLESECLVPSSTLAPSSFWRDVAAQDVSGAHAWVVRWLNRDKTNSGGRNFPSTPPLMSATKRPSNPAAAVVGLEETVSC